MAGRGYHHGDLKSALLQAARALLEEDGPEALSFRAIARAAGVSQAAPYNHFTGRTDLLAALAEAGFAELAAGQEAVTALPALGRAYLAFAQSHPQLYRLMYGVGVSDWCAHPAVMAAKSESFLPLRRALAAHMGGSLGREDVETAAVAAWAMVHGLAMLLLDRSLEESSLHGRPAASLADSVIALFVAGLPQVSRGSTAPPASDAAPPAPAG